MRRALQVILLLVLMLSLTLAVPPAQAAKQKWTVLVGGGVKGTAVVSNSFRPRTVEVAVGDTVTWDFQKPWTLHTVTFLSGQKEPEDFVHEGDKTYANPQEFFPAGGKEYDGTGYLNSGVAPQEPSAPPFSYSLTFTKAGTYKYQCLLHGPEMSGTVVVKDRVSASPASVAGRGRSELAATLKAGQAAFNKLVPERQGTTVVLRLIGKPAEGWTLLRFSRQPLVITRGTTVTWTVGDPFEIHTVTFTSGQKLPDFLVVEPQKQGPPKLLVPAQALNATQTKEYAGQGYVNSGILFPPGIPGNPPTSFSLTFTKSGRYEYSCVVHAPWGMKGTIIVK